MSWLALLPASAYAQSIAGVVKDSSGGVLPGVTVEATSPVLIEKTRSAVTDSTGQYRIAGPAAGHLHRDASRCPASPRSSARRRRDRRRRHDDQRRPARRQRVRNDHRDRRDAGGRRPDQHEATGDADRAPSSQAIPVSRGYGNLLATVPGIQGTGLDVSSNVSTNFFTARGGRGNEGTIQIDGMNVGSAFNGGGVAGFGYPIGEAPEIQITIAGGLGETDRGGPQFNMVPEDRRQQVRGTGFASTAGKWSQGNNLDDTLRSYGITEVPGADQELGPNFALGGPIVQGPAVVLQQRAQLRPAPRHSRLLYGNKNAGDRDASGPTCPTTV